MTFNIADFSAQISRMGLAKNNLFFMQITLPTGLRFIESSISTRDLTFLCKTASLPALELNTIDIRNTSLSPMEKRPYELVNSVLPVIFMVDSSFGVMKFFHRWFQTIINFNGANSEQGQDSQNKLAYEFDYKQNYVATIELFVYSGNNTNLVYSYKFYNAFPISLGEVTTSWENASDIMQLPVGFTYDKVSMTGLELGTVTSDQSRGNGLLTYLSSLNTYGQAINQIRRPRDIQDFINQLTNVSTILNSI